MKTTDEYSWSSYHPEYAAQLKQMKADGQDFFIKENKVLEVSAASLGYPHMINETVVVIPEYKENIHPNWKEIYDAAVILDPKTIYECGCGAGYHLKNLHTLLPDAEISGCDLRGEQIEFAKRFSDLPYSIGEKLEVVDMTQPVLSGKQYEFVFSQAVIMHLSTEHAKAFLQNMERLSSKYIFLVEGEANHEDWYGLVKKMLPDWGMHRPSRHIKNAILLVKRTEPVKQEPNIEEPKTETVILPQVRINSYLVIYQQNNQKARKAIDVNFDSDMTAQGKYMAIKEKLEQVTGHKNIGIDGIFQL